MSRWFLVLALVGCKGSGELNVGNGAEFDARLTSDVYTWDCEAPDTEWMGVFGFDVTLEFQPDALVDRALPPPGSCSYGLSMFAIDALESGESIPRASPSPQWSTSDDEGRMQPVVDGLYYADVFKNVRSCNAVDSVIISGVTLSDSGILDGATTPEAGEVSLVSVNSAYDSGIPFGEDINISWDTSGWSESFVQVRRVRDGVAYETVTCNTTGSDSFEVDNTVWDFFNPDLPVDLNYVYAGFQNTADFETSYGQKVEVSTRALHVVGVIDL